MATASIDKKRHEGITGITRVLVAYAKIWKRELRGKAVKRRENERKEKKRRGMEWMIILDNAVETAQDTSSNTGPRSPQSTSVPHILAVPPHTPVVTRGAGLLMI
jgi:hypothetical protein